MKTKMYLLVFFFSFSVMAIRAFGWGEIGHQATAELAERRISPQTRRWLLSVVGGTPLAVYSVIPDEVRSDSRFKEFGNYHFLEIPDGKTAKQIMQEMAGKKTADVFISKAAMVLKTKKLSILEKQLILQYLIHVVGDVHQPLHVGNGLDMGANLCYVKWVNPANGREENTNLHTVWDTKIFDYARKAFFESGKKEPEEKKGYFDYQAVLQQALKENPNFNEPIQLKPGIWYEESRVLHDQVYPGGKAKAEDRQFCKWRDSKTKKVVNGIYDHTKVPVLKEEYGKKALNLAYKQILRGGTRLSALLDDIAKAQPEPIGTPASFEALLKSVQLELLPNDPTALKGGQEEFRLDNLP